jgi:hypothetical protein
MSRGRPGRLHLEADPASRLDRQVEKLASASKNATGSLTVASMISANMTGIARSAAPK